LYSNIDSYKRWAGDIIINHHDQSVPRLVQFTGGTKFFATDLIKTPQNVALEQELQNRGIQPAPAE
jgi:hypothetical protein